MRHFRVLIVVALAGAGLLAWPATASAQSVSGSAVAVQGRALGLSTTLAGTGPLADALDMREASAMEAGILSLGGADVLHAATGSSVTDWGSSDYVASEASLADMALAIAGNSFSAAFVMARALAEVSGSSVASSEIDGLLINGVPVSVTGQPNQTLPLLGGRVIINEQIPTSTGTTVNAIHVIIDGFADLVLASASAGTASGGSTGLPPIVPVPPLTRPF
jgi:hypothetical protein